MSILKVDTIQKADGTGSLSVPAESGTVVTTASPSLGRRNLIINGAMQVAQRGTSFTGAANGALCLDRFRFNANRDEAVVDLSQATDAPTGFKYSKKITITTAETTVDAGNYIQTEYALEGNDISHLAYGTSNAKTLTLSFWVKSSSTGVFPVTLSNSGGNYHYPSSYTIDTANAWEYKTITISGATAGAWTTTGSSEGFKFRFGLTYGSTYNGATANQWLSSASFSNAFVTATNNVMTTTNATWQITGVQLEVGSVATPFEHRSYGEELALCKRYYEQFGNGWTVRGETTNISCVLFGGFAVEKRSSPSIGTTTSNVRMYEWGVANRDAATVSINSNVMKKWGGHVKLSGWSTIGTGIIYGMSYNTTTDDGEPFYADSEL